MYPAWLLLLLLFISKVEASVYTECDSSCQSSQQQALLSFYSATGGSDWKATSALSNAPAGWSSQAVTERGLPAHCSWSGAEPLSLLLTSFTYHAQATKPRTPCAGVFCCVPSGLPEGYPLLVVDPGAPQPYPSTMMVECNESLGVVALILGHLNLVGRLDGRNLDALASSLMTIDLGGMPQPPNTTATGAQCAVVRWWCASLCVMLPHLAMQRGQEQTPAYPDFCVFRQQAGWQAGLPGVTCAVDLP